MSNATPVTSQQYVLRKLLRHRSATIGASIILFFMIVAVFAPLIATHDPRHANVVERLQGWSIRTTSARTALGVTSSAGLSMGRVYL